MSTRTATPVAEKATETATILQAELVELIDLSLKGKQAHWAVTGPLFKPLHEHLDTLVDDARTWYDDVAERMAALGVAPDGRPATIVETSPLERMKAGFQKDGDVVVRFTEMLGGIAARLRERIDALADLDPISQDLLIGIGHGIEKHLWMFRVQAKGS
jgi:starvation-inducible DNA-binding protein